MAQKTNEALQKQSESKFFLFRREFLLFLAILGPGIITSMVDNDAGGITTYSIAGAHFGFALIWTMIPIMIILIIIQEMGARMGVVTGKGLADMIRENFGIKVTVYLLLAVLFVNFGNVLGEFAGATAAGQIVGINKFILIPLCALFVWVLVLKGKYSHVEKAFLFASLFYVSYIISAFLAKPNWGEVAHGIILPHMKLTTEYLMIVIGLIGTSIAPWMQFYLQSSIVEKGVKIKNYKYARADVIVGSILVNVIAVFIIIVCATTIFKAGIRIESAKDAALALGPLAGNYAMLLFSLGLFVASLFAMSILPLSTAYTFCEGMGAESGINKTFKEAPLFYSLYTGLLIVGGTIILFVAEKNLVPIMYISQVLNGILLPIIFFCMIKLASNKKLMGEYANSRLLNGASYFLCAVLLIVNIFFVLALLKVI